MTIIVCLDDFNGMAFNGRRQSRDRRVYEDVAVMVRNHKLVMHPRSWVLFQGLDLYWDWVGMSTDYLKNAAPFDFCFVEMERVEPVMNRVDRIVVYRWNRNYPADFFFEVNPESEGFALTEMSEFEGMAHMKITKLIYERKI